MWRIEFQALDARVALVVVDPPLVPALRGLTACYGPPSHGDWLAYRVCSAPAPQIHRDGQLLCTVEHEADLAPVFEHDLYAQARARLAPGACALHAAALRGAAGALLLVGASGAGKSTLALELVARGAHYLTDDCAVLDDDGRVRGLARPIGLASLAHSTSLGPALAVSRYAYRGRDGSPRSSLLIRPPADRLEHGAKPAGCVVFLERGRAPGLRRVAAGDALCRLWATLPAPGPAALAALIALMARAAAYEVSGENVIQVREAIESIWSLTE